MWYNYLNNPKEKSLLNEQKVVEGNIVVTQELKFRRYAVFKKNIDLFNFLQKIEDKQNCFYEILTENQPRIPYFDVSLFKPCSVFSACNVSGLGLIESIKAINEPPS